MPGSQTVSWDVLRRGKRNKTRETWERGRRRHPVSSQPPGVFLNSFYTRFLLNDFSPLSWSLEQAKWGVQVKTFLSDERQPEVMDFLQYSPVIFGQVRL